MKNESDGIRPHRWLRRGLLMLLAVSFSTISAADVQAQQSAQAGATILPAVIGGSGVQQEGDYGAFFATLGEPITYEPDSLSVIDQSTWIGFISAVATDPTSRVEESARPVISGATGIAETLPNPFTSRTRIVLQLEHPGEVRLSVYDQLGRSVRTLIDGVRTAGEITVDWTPENLPSGTYLLLLELDGVRHPARLIQYYR